MELWGSTPNIKVFTIKMKKARTIMPTHQDQHANTPESACQLQKEQETLVKIGWRMDIYQEEATKALSVDGINTPGPACQHTRTPMPTHQDQHAPYFVSCSFCMEYIQKTCLSWHLLFPCPMGTILPLARTGSTPFLQYCP